MSEHFAAVGYRTSSTQDTAGHDDGHDEGRVAQVAQATLGLWVLTMMGGAYLFSFTWSIGRPDSTARATALPPLVMFTHPLLAGAGFVSWIAFMAAGDAFLAWTSVGFLLAAAALGDVLTLRTAKAEPEKVRTGPGREPADFRRAEKQIPHSGIVAHGALAVATIAMAVVVAIGAS